MNVQRLLAVDSGYGGTKYTYKGENGLVEQYIPSIAVRVDDQHLLDSFGINQRDVIVVDVDGQQFVLGRDADQLLSPYSSRTANFES